MRRIHRIATTVLLGAALAAPGARGQSAQSASSTASVEGEIHGLDASGVRPLPYALIELVGDSVVVRTRFADASGRYRLEGVAGGLWTIRARHVGYDPVEAEVLVPGSGSVRIDLELGARPIPVPGVAVLIDPLRIPEAGDREAASDATRALVGLMALEASPGLAEAGLGQAVRSLPGNPPAEPDQVLFMRGSTTDLKLVLLDGAPVYTPFHMAGLLRSFDVSGLGAASHHVGGAPARYDGGLSYILDLRTRPVRRDGFHASGSADLLSLQGMVEGPLGEGAGLRVQARRLHGAQSRLMGSGESPYGYQDILARVEADVGRHGRLSVTGFLNDESVGLDLPESVGIADRSSFDAARWGNDALSAAFQGRAGDVHVDVGAAATRYHAELPVPDPTTGSPGYEGQRSTVVATGTTERIRLTAEASRFGGSGGLRIGGSVDHVSIRYGTRPLVTPTPTSELRTSGRVVGAYLDGVRSLAPEVDLRYGARLDHFDPGGARAALRLALLWSLSDDAILTLAGGRYHQHARLTDTDQVELTLGDGSEVGRGPVVPVDPARLLTVASADHLVLTLDQLLSPPLRLTLEGFYKSFRGLTGIDRDRHASSGVDLRVTHRGDDVTGWLGYSLAWFWETTAGSPGDFSGRHLLSAGLRSRLPGSTGLDLSFALSDGLPLTAVPLNNPDRSNTLPSTPVGEQDDPLDREIDPLNQSTDGFLRVDAELYALWNPTVGGRTMRLRPYLRVLNALNRRDALFHYFDRWRGGGPRPLAELSLLPVLGVEWHF